MNPDGQKELTETFLLRRVHDAPGFVRQCADRVTAKDGGQKYYDPDTDTMLFETMPLEELYVFTEEEILDIPNYAVMLMARGQVGSGRLVELAHELWEELAKMRANN